MSTSATYSQLSAKVPNETAEAIKAYAAERETTVGQLLKTAVNEMLNPATAPASEPAREEPVPEDASHVVVKWLLRSGTVEELSRVAAERGLQVDVLVDAALSSFLAAGW